MDGMKLMGVLACIAISGCASLSKELDGYLGRDVHELTARLGYPAGERMMMGDHMYVWSNDHTGLMPVTSLQTTTGSFGGTPYYGQTTSMGLMPMRAQCTLEVVVDAHNVIQTYQFNGNHAGCDQYARRLK